MLIRAVDVARETLVALNKKVCAKTRRGASPRDGDSEACVCIVVIFKRVISGNDG